MNTQLYEQAVNAYIIKDYETALSLYSSCLRDPNYTLMPGEAGKLYHQIGNCLFKSREINEAIHVYVQATADENYSERSTVNFNLGLAYAALGDYAHAVRFFEIAVASPDMKQVYKINQSLGSALLKLGKSAEAGVAFRNAALDDQNPDPTRALLNLGICYMALDRPEDAIVAYQHGLHYCSDKAIVNKLNANLGQAFASTGQHKEAVDAFEQSLKDHTYTLSDSASVDYTQAIAKVASGQSEATTIMTPLASNDFSGLDVVSEEPGIGVEPRDPSQAYAQSDPYYYQEPYAMSESTTGEHFFEASEQELEQWSNNLRKQDRKHRNVGLKIVITLFAVITLVAAALVFLYSQGFGLPTQKAVAEKFFDAPGADSTIISSSLTQSEIDEMVSLVIPYTSYTVDGENKELSKSEVFVTATGQDSSTLTYRIEMVRDGIGWDIYALDLYFPSKN